MTEQTQPTDAKTKCPKCGAPCETTVNMRGGEHGWGTTDLERTVYRYAPQPTQAQDVAVPLTQYRVLEPRVDRIEAEDEFLQDDAQTWATDPNGTFVGTIYGYALRAARRRIKGCRPWLIPQ